MWEGKQGKKGEMRAWRSHGWSDTVGSFELFITSFLLYRWCSLSSSDILYTPSEQNPIDQPAIEKWMEMRAVFIISQPNVIWVIFKFIFRVIKKKITYSETFVDKNSQNLLFWQMGLWPFISCAYRQAQPAEGNYCEKHVNKINLTKSFQNIVLGFTLKRLVYWGNKERYYFALIFLNGYQDFCYMNCLPYEWGHGGFLPSYLCFWHCEIFLWCSMGCIGKALESGAVLRPRST